MPRWCWRSKRRVRSFSARCTPPSTPSSIPRRLAIPTISRIHPGDRVRARQRQWLPGWHPQPSGRRRSPRSTGRRRIAGSAHSSQARAVCRHTGSPHWRPPTTHRVLRLERGRRDVCLRGHCTALPFAQARAARFHKVGCVHPRRPTHLRCRPRDEGSARTYGRRVRAGRSCGGAAQVANLLRAPVPNPASYHGLRSWSGAQIPARPARWDRWREADCAHPRRADDCASAISRRACRDRQDARGLCSAR